MGEVPEGHEVLSDAERDQHLAEYNHSDDVSAAHEIVSAEFARHERSETSDGTIAERISDIKREMFWLNSEIDKQIGLRPDAQRLKLRDERTDVFRRYEKVMDQFRLQGAEDTKDFLDILTTYKDELSEILHRLEGESGSASQAQ